MGWAWVGVVSGGSAGSCLRSQGTWGQARLSRCRAMGIRVSTFQSSLRPGPAAAGWFGRWAGAWGESWVGAPRDRSCARRERWGRLSFRAVARWGSGCRRSNACSGPIPLPPGGSVVGLALGVSRGWGLRGIGPARAGNVGDRLGFRAVARWGSGCRRSNACSGPVPLPLGGSVVGLALGVGRRWGLRGIGPARAGNVGTGSAFALSRDGDQGVDVPMLAPARSRCRWVVRSLGWRLGWVVGGGSAGSCLRAQGSSGEDGVIALCARGRFDRFQCSLRPGPAAASRLSGGSENLGRI
jgi:hypothetical protein